MNCPICEPGRPCRAHQPVEVESLQLDLTKPVTKYQTHSDTSRQAAKKIETSADTVRGRVLRFLVKNVDGATDEAMQYAMWLNPNTQRPRRIELVERGLVKDSGVRRNTKSGRKAIVWEAT